MLDAAHERTVEQLRTRFDSWNVSDARRKGDAAFAATRAGATERQERQAKADSALKTLRALHLPLETVAPHPEGSGEDDGFQSARSNATSGSLGDVGADCVMVEHPVLEKEVSGDWSLICKNDPHRTFSHHDAPEAPGTL